MQLDPGQDKKCLTTLMFLKVQLVPKANLRWARPKFCFLNLTNNAIHRFFGLPPDYDRCFVFLRNKATKVVLFDDV